jgi:probable blue pigment (indigoidine) exporter
MSRAPGELLMAIVAILWGSAFPVTRILLDEMPPLGAATWRALLAASAVALVLALRGDLRRAWPSAGHRVRLGTMAVLGGALFAIGMNVAVALTGAAITSFVTGMYPLLALAIAAVLLGEPLARRAIGALAVTTIGLFLLARPGGAHVELLGVLAAVGAALSFATYLVLARRWSDPDHLSPLSIALALLLSTVVVTGGAQLVSDPAGLQVDLSVVGWAALIWLALPASALPHVLVVTTMRRLPASRAAPYLMLMPVSGAILAAVLLDEQLDPLQLLGAGLMLAGIAAATIPMRARAPAVTSGC